MKLTDKLDSLIKQRGISRRQFAAEAGVPYTTIMGLYDKGYENIKMSTLRPIALYFGISLDILSDDSAEIDGPDGQWNEFKKKYARISDESRRLMDTIIDGVINVEKGDSVEKPEEYIREYLTPRAVGAINPAQGRDYTLVIRDEDVPQGADFSLRAPDKSMSPYIREGERIFARRTNEVKNGNIGLFSVEGDVLCRQLYCDDEGKIYLRAMNRGERDRDIEIDSGNAGAVLCLAKVIYDRALPVPKGR